MTSWKVGAKRGAGGRGAAVERGAGVTEIGWSTERVFRRSHDLNACYSVLCLRRRIFLCMVRLVHSSSRVGCCALSVSMQ